MKCARCNRPVILISEREGRESMVYWRSVREKLFSDENDFCAECLDVEIAEAQAEHWREADAEEARS